MPCKLLYQICKVADGHDRVRHAIVLEDCLDSNGGNACAAYGARTMRILVAHTASQLVVAANMTTLRSCVDACSRRNVSYSASYASGFTSMLSCYSAALWMHRDV